jgi:STE24 endopeptidase
LEEKYGLNKKSLSLFFNDLVIETGLSVVINPSVLYGYIYITDSNPEWFFFKVEVFLITVTLTMITIYPNLIAPLFNKF